MNRRTFLHTATLASLAAQIQSLRAATAGMKIKIGACDWTMTLAAQPAALDLAKRIGLDGVQVDFGRKPDAQGRLPLFDEKLQDSYLAKSAELGIAVPSLAMSVLNDVPRRLTELRIEKEKRPRSVPASLYWQPGGWLPWGRTTNGTDLCWEVWGELIDNWKVVALGTASRAIRAYDFSISDFVPRFGDECPRVPQFRYDRV